MASLDLSEENDKLMPALAARMAALEARDAARATAPDPRKLGNPAPLGLLGFAVVTYLAGITKLIGDAVAARDGMLAGTGVFIGGLAQIVAGSLQYARDFSHGATVFCFFGFHWTAQGTLMLLRARDDLPTVPDERMVCTYYALLAASTAVLWVPTFRMNNVLNATLFSVFLLFTFDAISAFGSRGAEVVAGIMGVIASTGALYMCLLDLVNEYWGRNVLPLFRVDRHSHDFRHYHWLEKVHIHKSPL